MKSKSRVKCLKLCRCRNAPVPQGPPIPASPRYTHTQDLPAARHLSILSGFFKVVVSLSPSAERFPHLTTWSPMSPMLTSSGFILQRNVSSCLKFRNLGYSSDSLGLDKVQLLGRKRGRESVTVPRGIHMVLLIENRQA